MSIPNSFSDETIEKLASPEALFAKSLEIKSGAQVHHPQADTFHAAAVRIERLLEENAALKAAVRIERFLEENAALKAAAAPAAPVEAPEYVGTTEPRAPVARVGQTGRIGQPPLTILEENAALKAAAAPAAPVEAPEFAEVVEKSHARKKDH